MRRNLTIRWRKIVGVGALLAAAAPFEVEDVLSREPNLEEFFLTLYGTRGNDHAR